MATDDDKKMDKNGEPAETGAATAGGPAEQVEAESKVASLARTAGSATVAGIKKATPVVASSAKKAAHLAAVGGKKGVRLAGAGAGKAKDLVVAFWHRATDSEEPTSGSDDDR